MSLTIYFYSKARVVCSAQNLSISTRKLPITCYFSITHTLHPYTHAATDILNEHAEAKHHLHRNMTSESETPANMNETRLVDQAEASSDLKTDTDRASMRSLSHFERHRSRPSHLRALSSQSDAESSGDTIPGSPPQEAKESTPSLEAISGSFSPPRLRRAGLNRHRNRPRQLSAAGLLDTPQPSPLSRSADIEEEVNVPALSRANTAPISQADFAYISAPSISYPEDLIHIPTLSLEETQLLPDINTINRINAEIAWGVPKPSPSPIPTCLHPSSRASSWPTEDPTASSSQSRENINGGDHDVVSSKSAQRYDTSETQAPRQIQSAQNFPSHGHAKQDSGDLGYCTCRPVIHRQATTAIDGRCVICKLPVPPPPRYR